jgi:hypothetical protein
VTVAKKRSPKTAFDLVVSYTREGDHGQASRVYVESSLSYKRYLEARTIGLRNAVPNE